MSDSPYILATVVSIGTVGLALRFDDDENTRVKEYKCLASYIPKANDRVLVIAISGTYLVLGRVVNAPTTSLTADNAIRLQTARTIGFSGGDVTGSFQFSGAQNVTGIILDCGFSDRAAHVQNQNSTGEGSDIYLRVVSNKLNFKVGSGGTWYVITSA